MFWRKPLQRENSTLQINVFEKFVNVSGPSIDSTLLFLVVYLFRKTGKLKFFQGKIATKERAVYIQCCGDGPFLTGSGSNSNKK